MNDLLICGLSGGSVGVIVWMIAYRMVHADYEAIGKRRGAITVPIFFKILLPITPLLFPTIRKPNFTRSVDKVDTRLTMAGADQLLTAEQYLSLQMIYVIAFCPIGLLLLVGSSSLLAIIGFIVFIYGAAYPMFWMYMIIKKRHKDIQRALPGVLDLLTLSVEAGRDFLTALRDILRNRAQDPLGEELERVFREIQLGKQRRQALRGMADRVRQGDLSQVIDTLVQADELGVSIGAILRILSDQMRQKRFQLAEKLANEAPVKLLFPLIVFIFPAVIIVMLGPVLMQSFQQFQF